MLTGVMGQEAEGDKLAPDGGEGEGAEEPQHYFKHKHVGDAWILSCSHTLRKKGTE